MPVILRALHALAVPVLCVGALAGLAATSASSSPFSYTSAAPATAPSSTPAPQRILEGVELRPEPSTWVAPLRSYRVTGRFGASSSLWSRTHTGLDLASASGTPIRSVAEGVVTSAGYDGAYGYKTVVELEDGTEVWYCHQSTLAVGVGERLDVGEVLGYVGASGNVTGPHLHLEVRPHGADPVDPYDALLEEGVRL